MELSFIYLFLCIVHTLQAPICRPIITDGQLGEPNIGGFIVLECEISTCINTTKMFFEKGGPNATWTPLFEGVNKTYYKALNSDSKYNLQNRHDYYAFRTSVHSLHISQLKLEDHGEWRCVVHDIEGNEYQSRPLDVNVYVPPAEGHFYISHNNSHLVVGQIQEFVCLVDGINPEPDVLWEVNGVEYKGNTTTNQRDDQLWVVKNAVRLKLENVGTNTLNCIMTIKGRGPWVEKHIDITVQEAATVLYPQRDKTETVDVHAKFSLKCSGSGYYPRISWNRNGERILINDTRYIIIDDCDLSKCEGSLTSKPMEPTVPCTDQEDYSVVYTCEIIVKPPYESSALSANINVTFSKQECKQEHIGPTVASYILPVVIVALMISCIVLLVCWIRRRRRHNTGRSGKPLLKLKEKPESFTPPYKTQKWLQLCYQSEEYNTLVFYDYGVKSVYIHNSSDFKEYKVCTCLVKIYNMIRLSQDRFVVTELKTHNIHLLQLQNLQFYKLATMADNIDARRTLICAENDNSFIKCEFSGDDLQYQVTIYRVCIADNKLTQQIITNEPFPVNGEPWRISLIGTGNELVIINLCGRIYRGRLENYNSDIYDDTLSKRIGGGLRSLYLDKYDNLIVGTRSGKIHVYTPEKQHRVMQMGKTVYGITVIDELLIICCGTDEKQQYIKVFSYHQLHK